MRGNFGWTPEQREVARRNDAWRRELRRRGTQEGGIVESADDVRAMLGSGGRFLARFFPDRPSDRLPPTSPDDE